MSAPLKVPVNYEPREQFSPSGLELLSRCSWAWMLRYVQGIKEADFISWWEARKLVKPKAPPKSAARILHAEHRAKVKDYNRRTRRALGHAIHHCLYVFYDWHPPLIDVWTDEEWAWPCSLAMAGLDLLPRKEHCETLWLEEEWNVLGKGVKLFGFADMVAQLKRWLLVDHKSTSDFAWVKTPEELQDDIQACFYALAVMVEVGLTEIDCRWVYYLTDETKPPEARAVDFTITRAHAEEILAPHFERARAALVYMRASKVERLFPLIGRTKNVIAHNPLACDDFGGCVYKGTHCKPPELSHGAQMRRLAERDVERRARRGQPARGTVSKGVRAPRARALRSESYRPDTKGGQIRMATKNAFKEKLAARRAGTDSAAVDEDGASEETGGGGGSTTSSATSKATSTPRTNVAKKPKAKSDSPEISILVGDMTIPLPESSPLYARALRVAEALFEE